MNLTLLQCKIHIGICNNTRKSFDDTPHFQYKLFMGRYHPNPPYRVRRRDIYPGAQISYLHLLTDLLIDYFVDVAGELRYNKVAGSDPFSPLQRGSYCLRRSIVGVTSYDAYAFYIKAEGDGLSLEVGIEQHQGTLKHTNVNPLDHGVQNSVGCYVSLVGVYTDSPYALLFTGFDHAQAGCTSGVEDNVCTAADHGLGNCFTLGRVVECAGIVADDLDVRIDVPNTCIEISFESLDYRNLDTTYKTNFAGLGGFGSQYAYQEGTFMLFEEYTQNVLQLSSVNFLVKAGVNDTKSCFRILRRNFLDGVFQQEADGPYHIIALASEHGQVGFIVRRCTGLYIPYVCAEFFLQPH